MKMYYTNLNSPNQTYDVNHPFLHFFKTNLIKLITGLIILLLFMEYASYIYVYTNSNNQNLTPNFSIKKDDFFFENKFKLLDDFQSNKSGRKINFNVDPPFKEFNFVNDQHNVNNSNSSLSSQPTTCPLIPPNLGRFLRFGLLKNL